MTLRKSLLFFLFDFKQFSLKTNNNEGLKKFSNFEKHECAVLTFCVATFVKARFFFLFCLNCKRQRMNKKTEGPVQLLFCLVSLSHYKMVLFTKKTICLLEALFSENTKKKNFLICARNIFWVACFKNKSKCWTSVVLRRVLKERQR